MYRARHINHWRPNFETALKQVKDTCAAYIDTRNDEMTARHVVYLNLGDFLYHSSKHTLFQGLLQQFEVLQKAMNEC